MTETALCMLTMYVGTGPYPADNLLTMEIPTYSPRSGGGRYKGTSFT